MHVYVTKNNHSMMRGHQISGCWSMGPSLQWVRSDGGMCAQVLMVLMVACRCRW